MKIGVIGTDSSHAIAFVTRLQKKGHNIIAFKGGSPLALSQSRIETITMQLKEMGVTFVDTLAQLHKQCDAFLITSVDAAQHSRQFEELVLSKKPVFIDKPLANNSEQASKIIKLAKRQGIPLMSCSALRFADSVQQAKRKSIEAVDVVAPLLMLEPYDYFYYGIHALEIIGTLKPGAIQSLTVQCQAEQHFITLHFEDGTISTIRGYLQKRQSFQFAVHDAVNSDWHEIAAGDVQFYDRLVDEIEQFFITKKSPITEVETLQIIRTLERITASAK